MSKYQPLRDYLENSRNRTEVMSFQELVRILRFPLSASASTYPAWWANETTGAHSHAKAWLEAGWRVENVRLGFQVTFSKNTNEKNQERTYKQENAHEQKKSYEQRKPYTTPQELYAYFNCPYPCDKNQLDKAYKKLIGQYHPDKVATMGPEIRKVAEEETKKINDIYEKAKPYLKE